MYSINVKMSYLAIPECGVRLVAAVTLRWQRSTDVGCSLASPSLRPRRGHFNQRTLLDNIYNLHPHLTLTLANIFIDISDSYHQSIESWNVNVDL